MLAHTTHPASEPGVRHAYSGPRRRARSTLPRSTVPGPGLLKFLREAEHGIWIYAHKLQFSRDGFDIWFVSLFTVVVVVVLDNINYMRCIYIS